MPVGRVARRGLEIQTIEASQIARGADENTHVVASFDELSRQTATQEPRCSGDNRAHGSVTRRRVEDNDRHVVVERLEPSGERMPISIESSSQSTSRIIMRGPSSSSTIAAT